MQSSKDKTVDMKLRNLRLKNSNTNSIPDFNIQRCSENKDNDKKTFDTDDLLCNKNIPDLSNPEDSLADFISPKKPKDHKLILNKFKFETKVQKKITKSKNKLNTKSKKKSSNKIQPLIESSFFIQQSSDQNELKKSIPCPLCLKPFKDDITCTNHMKTCASKNNVSIKQLLKAKQLQDRQIEERKAMGLLPTPIIPEKKKVYRSKNFSTGDDPQLQLALAVSESLYEAEQKTDLEHAALLAGIPSNYIQELSEEEHRATLKSFGFTTNKALNDFPSTKSKKKKLLGPTILQTRSKEEKDRVLTERIVCILTGDDAFTQPQQKIEIISQLNSPTTLKSKFLQNIEQVDNKLWDRSKLIENCDFYVEQLKSHFPPEENKSIDCKLLSTNINDKIQNIILLDESVVHKTVDADLTYDKNKEHFLFQENKSIVNELLTNNVQDNEYKSVDSYSSIIHETMNIDIINDKKREQNCSSSLNVSDTKNVNWELTYSNNIVLDWRNGLNDSVSSDTIIFVKNNKYVYAHKLVFHIRHSNILLDIEQNKTNIHPEKQNKICWFKYDELSTLAFLEYIYCSNIEKNISIFEDDNLMSEVKKLGKLYPVKDLFEYLQRKKNEYSARRLVSSKSTIDNQVSINIPIKKCNTSNIRTNISSTIQSIETNNSTVKSNLYSSLNETELSNTISTNFSKKNYINRRITVSPDLFESENEDETIYTCKTQENNIEKNQNCTNLKTLKDIIDNNKKSPVNKNFDEIECINSPKIVEISSPENDDKSLIILPLEDIYQAETPKRISQNDNIDYNYYQTSETTTPKCISEEIGSQIDQISKAVTPEAKKLSRLNDYMTPKKAVRVNTEEDNITNDETIEIDNLINVAVTSPKSNNTNYSRVKSDLSLFIAKVQRKNAKCIFDSDSESDTSSFQIKKRNPFLKKDRSLNSLLNIDNKSQDKKAISLIEKDVLEDEKLNNIMKIKYNSKAAENENISNNNKTHDLSTNSFSNLNLDLDGNYIDVESPKTIRNCINQNRNEKSVNISTSDDETEDMNESEMSMYSKYKKLNKHHNSIKKYRDELNFNKFFSSSLPRKLSKSNTSATQNPIIKDITLVSDSDEEKNIQISQIDNDSDLCHPDDDQLDQSQITIMKKSTSFEKNSTSKFIDLSLRSNNSPKKTNKHIRENFLEISKKNEKNNDDVDAEIKKILESSLNFTAYDKILSKEHPKTSSQEKVNQDINEIIDHKDNNSQNEIINLSPISIISSPELCSSDNDNLNQSNKKNNKFKIFNSTKKKQNDLNLTDNKYCDKQDFNELIKDLNTHRKKLNLSSNPSSAKNSQISQLFSSPILSKNIKTQISSSNSSTNKKKQNESLKHISTKTKKLKTKSASTLNLTEKIDKFNWKKSSSFVTPEQNKKLSQKFSKYEENVTPPIDYNLLGTPDLEKELKKFGLKRQSRDKAKLLLNHIYNETHPVVSLSQKRTLAYDSSSEDELIFENQNIKKKFKTNTSKESFESTSTQNLENCQKIPEEMEYDDEPNTANTLENSMNIKDAFFKLIESDKKLYTDILMYKPLSLESLHLTLKENGFKCNINTLMDFLDEQCITFQVQKNKQSRQK